MMDANAVLQGFLSADAARIRGAAFDVLYAKHDAAKLASLFLMPTTFLRQQEALSLAGFLFRIVSMSKKPLPYCVFMRKILCLVLASCF